MLSHELQLGRIDGPFKDPPFPNFKSSPLAVREKHQSGKFRLLHNLSYPYDERSLNFNIPKEASEVSYATINDAIKYIQECHPHAYMAKSDISEAFRLIPLHQSQYHLTGFHWKGFYFDKCLPQGCSSSCRIFEHFSDSLKWILEHKFNVQNIVKYLDDFLFIANTKSECQRALKAFTHLCSDIGVPLAPHKTIEPTNIITFLGIELDSISMYARLPIEKLNRYTQEIESFITKNKITLRELKSLIGMLQFATRVVTPGRPFLRRMYDLTMQANNPFHFVRITKSVKLDLQIWLSFLNRYNGMTIIREPSISDSHNLHFYSDSSKFAFGATYGSYWIQGTWPLIWQNEDIAVLELYPIFIAVCIFAVKIRNSRITFHCDNQAIVTIINKQTSKDPTIMQIIRPLVLTLLEHNITFKAEHIPSNKNVLCDKISRLQVSPTLLRRYGMKPDPIIIPDHLKPENFKLQ